MTKAIIQKTPETYNYVGAIMAYECGQLDAEATYELFNFLFTILAIVNKATAKKRANKEQYEYVK